MTGTSPSQDGPQVPLTVWGRIWRVLLMLLISAAVWSTVVVPQWQEQRRLFWVDVVLGVLSFVVVWWRRQHPVAIALLTCVLSVPSALAAGPATLAAVSMATRRRTPELLGLGLATFVAAQAFPLVQPAPGEPMWLTASVNAAFTAATLAIGMYIGSRRELLWTLRQRAERAEAEQELRVSRARVGERAAIAREMHDVLAHRISQISMHAGALAIRDDLGADALREGVATIQGRANDALHDLRDVLGVLRDAESGELAARPQPTYCDLPELVERARESGLRVDLVDAVTEPDELPVVVGRTVYRIVQEGITNAGKHASGTTVSVTVSGDAASGVEVEVRNPRPVGGSNGVPATPGAGLGLLGLAERTELRGGRLTHHHEDGQFVLRGWVPWTT